MTGVQALGFVRPQKGTWRGGQTTKKEKNIIKGVERQLMLWLEQCSPEPCLVTKSLTALQLKATIASPEYLHLQAYPS